MYNGIKNKGSATVELCLVAPIFLFIVCMFIGVFIKGINEGVIRGKAYVNLFSCDFRDDSENINNYFEHIYSGESGLSAAQLMAVEQEQGIIELKVSTRDDGIWNRINPVAGQLGFSLEDKAVDRLRRWQLYGDVLWE
ncbi:MAG: hypothetical protein ACI4D8_06750 [Wujia sp.]